MLSLLATAARSRAFFAWGYTWNFGREVAMHLNLEGPAQTFQDGSSSWAEVASSAMNIWNAEMNTARLVPAGAASSVFGDRVNTVQFSDSIYGQSFGSNVLAVTLVDRIYFNPSALCEADVFFNKAKRFDSYRGPLQSDANGPIYDLRRVAIHELGHALGLLHPDANNQSVVSIMNSGISDLDNLAEDDITGIRSLYWLDVMGKTTTANVALAQPFSYQLVSANATSFSATGLPPGLTIDTATGIISGKPLKSGTYDIQVAAYGQGGTVTGTIRITIQPPQITSSPVTFPLLGQPFFYQITTDLEPVSFEARDVPPGLTLDPQTGLISGIPTIRGGTVPYNGTTVIAHGAYEDASLNVSMNVFFPLPPTDPPLSVLGFYCDNLVSDPVRRRIYGVTSQQSLRIIDGDTLAIIKEFPVEAIIGTRLTNDGRSLWIFRSSLKRLARLDLDALDQIVEVPAIDYLSGFLEGLDGRIYAEQSSDIIQMASPSGPIEQRIVLSGQQYSPPQTALSPDRRTLFLAERYLPGNGSLVTRSAVSRYDVSSTVPTLLQRVEMPAPFVQLTVSPDGTSVYVKLDHFEGARHAWQRTLCLSADDLTVTKGTLNYEGEAGPLTFSPDGKLALQMVQLGDGGSFTTALLEIFDSTTFALRKTIVLGSARTFGLPLSNAVLDATGSRIIAGAGLASEYTEDRLMVYSAELPPLPPPSSPKTLLNLSTRLKTNAGDDSLIGGFIVTGLESKKVIIRAIGPTLPLPGKLLDPILELHGPDGRTIASNDNWNEHRNDVLATGIAPLSDYESALVATLAPGAYTAVLRGTANSSGIAVLELYDLASWNSAEFANIATRGKVDGGDNVMIGGFIVGGGQPTDVIVRALGPSLGKAGVANAVDDPMLEMYDGNGVLLAQDDDWRASQEQVLLQKGLAPADERESAMFLTLQPGAYTAVVRAKNNGAGVGLVEVYNLDAN
jgi:hypothetical protein